MKEDGHTVINCEDDTNTQSVEAALDHTCEKENITAFVEDTLEDTLQDSDMRNFHERQQKEESNSKVGKYQKNYRETESCHC